MEMKKKKKSQNGFVFLLFCLGFFFPFLLIFFVLLSFLISNVQNPAETPSAILAALPRSLLSLPPARSLLLSLKEAAFL